ncbi:MAG: hypothetical protein DRZ82_04800 [Thermoprotei archaeon]|nr:MAG: hypothetical protein DRZ82_04800 [Thermoprotei archaeon]
MDMPKIVLIGAGSWFTLSFISDLFRVGDLWGSELVLVDIDPEKAKIAERMVTNTIKEHKVDLKVTSTTDRREALDGADFVIISIRVGGTKARRIQMELPLKYGAYQCISDTVGGGALLKGLCEIPEIVNIARDMEDLCPKALMMNLTNPLTAVCMAVNKITKIRVVGLCHGLVSFIRLASKLLNVSEEMLTVLASGINHLTWVTDIRVGMENLYPEFERALYDPKNEKILMEYPGYLISREIYEVFKLFPAQGDRHVSEFFRFFKEWLKNPKYRKILQDYGHIDFDTLKEKEEDFIENERRWQYFKAVAEGKEKLRIVPTHELAVDIISSIVNAKTRTLYAVNVPNEGLIPGLPEDAVVEVPGIVGSYGVKGINVGKLPDAILGILNLHITRYKLMVEGVLNMDKELMVQALMLDPLIPSIEAARRIVEDGIRELSSIIKLT